MQVLLIALNYTIVGYNEKSHQIGTRSTVKKLGGTTPKSRTAMNIGKAEMMINPIDDNATKSNNPTMNIDVCRGECCSRYGMNFIECITYTFNVNSMAIDDIMHECHFVEGKNSETMTNKEKRFLLY